MQDQRYCRVDTGVSPSKKPICIFELNIFLIKLQILFAKKEVKKQATTSLFPVWINKGLFNKKCLQLHMKVEKAQRKSRCSFSFQKQAKTYRMKETEMSCLRLDTHKLTQYRNWGEERDKSYHNGHK